MDVVSVGKPSVSIVPLKYMKELTQERNTWM
jgi:hypothetical protein